MDIRVTQTIINKIYSVKFDIIPNDDENKLLNKYGDPYVNYGGVINYDDDQDPQTPEIPFFSLPDNWRALRAGTGWIQKFDGNIDAQALEKATEYVRNVKIRISAAVTTLRSNNDTFTNTITETV